MTDRYGKNIARGGWEQTIAASRRWRMVVTLQRSKPSGERSATRNLQDRSDVWIVVSRDTMRCKRVPTILRGVASGCPMPARQHAKRAGST